MLGADVVSFQTEVYRDNFVRTCARLRQDVRVEGRTIALARRRVRTAAHPISIDARGLAESARSAATERSLRGLRAQFGGRRILLGVDRLDYTKGIIERLRAIELLLEGRPELRGRVAFVQIAVRAAGRSASTVSCGVTSRSSSGASTAASPTRAATYLSITCTAVFRTSASSPTTSLRTFAS